MVDFCRSGHKFKKDDAREDILAEGFGVDDWVHFLILRCCFPTHLAIAGLRSDLCFVNINLKRNENMKTVFKM